jgi:hypothetical protein
MEVNSIIAALVLAVLGGAGAYQQTEQNIPKTVIGVALGGAVGYLGSNALNKQQQSSSADKDEQAEIIITEQVVETTTERPDSGAESLAAKKTNEEDGTLAEATEVAKKAQAQAEAPEEAEAQQVERLGPLGRAHEAFKESRETGGSIFDSLKAAQEAF